VFRPVLETRIAVVGDTPDQGWDNNATVPFSLVISHSEQSRAEPTTASIKLVLDKYTDIALKSVTTNYSVADLVLVTSDEGERTGRVVNIVFPSPLLFQDYIQINFNLILNGFGLRTDYTALECPVLVSATCGTTPHAGYPLHSSTQCGGVQVVVLPISPSTCRDLLVLHNPHCQIRAATSRDGSPGSAPHNSITTDRAWQSPVRTGSRWDTWIQFDFLTLVRVTRIVLGWEDDTRGPSMVRVDHSNTESHFNTGETVFVGADSSLELSSSVRGRYLRLVIMETNDVTPSIKPITLTRVQFYGCTLHSRDQWLPGYTSARVSRRVGGSSCSRVTTVPSTDPGNYRHFAVDNINTVLYFCDQSMHRAGLACYSSSDQGHSWTELPRYVGRVVGFSRSRGRMFLQDVSGKALLTSMDGRRLDVATNHSLDHVSDPALNYPGEPVDHPAVLWPGSAVSANFEGLHVGTQKVADWASCCAA